LSVVPLVSGYANRFQALFRHLHSNRSHFEVITVDVVNKEGTPSRPTSHLGATVHHTKAFPVPFYDQLGVSIDWKLKIPRVIRRMRPDILHVSSPGAIVFAGLLYSRLFQIPIVSSYHTHIPVYVRSYVPKFLGLRYLCEKLVWMIIGYFHSFMDATVVTSPQIQQEFIDRGIPKCFLWEKGVDTERFHPKHYSHEMRNRMTNNHPDDFLILCVGRLGREKRLKELKAILDGMPSNARLCIVGHGPYEVELRKQFADSDRTIFTGLLQGEELSSAFASADAFCMPSDSETLGFVVLESMASEVPVVGCNAGGIPHTIRPVENSGSFLVETGNIDGYIKHLKLLQDNPLLRKRMGITAREEMLKWSWDDSMVALREQTYQVAFENKKNRFENRLWRALTFHGWHQDRHLNKDLKTAPLADGGTAALNGLLCVKEV
jgi:sulfoquinovosyltransferase